jgi:hypothetical protein
VSAARVRSRSCSSLLQRRVTDFGADVPFSDVSKKLIEHYGITLCPEIIRKTTLNHAKKMQAFLSKKQEYPSKGVKQLIAEADGGMVPIVQTEEGASDKRKTRKVLWKEARLCFCREVDSVKASFRATLGSIEKLGDMWFSSALEAGIGEGTKIHCLGDGALWINEEVGRIFGKQGTYLVDFYHVSEYLAKASEGCSTKEKAKEWQVTQQEYLKEGNLYLVLQELEKHLYVQKNENESVRECYRYLTNRLNQLNYLDAILNDLPIGSGEIESGHRHVVQKRLKRAGSWWKEDNAEVMLQLLTLRTNELWNSYWKEQRNGLYDVAA